MNDAAREERAAKGAQAIAAGAMAGALSAIMLLAGLCLMSSRPVFAWQLMRDALGFAVLAFVPAAFYFAWAWRETRRRDRAGPY